MRRRTAAILCVLILGGVAALDILLLTNAQVLGRIAALQIRKHAGNLVDFESLTVTIGGQLRMEHMALRTPDPLRPILTARRVRVAIGHREGGIVAESVALDEPRVRFSDSVARDLESGPSTPKRPLHELVSSRYLPRTALAHARPNDGSAAAAVPLLVDRGLLDGRPAAYVCEGFVCRQPVTTPDALLALLA